MSKRDSFEKEFAKLRELGDNVFRLLGSTLIIEVLPEQELKTEGGLILATVKDHVKGGSIEAHKIEIGRVLMSGQGYWDEETKSYIPLEIKPGAIVFLPQYGTQYISLFPGVMRPTGNKLAMIKESEVLAYYPSEEAFETAKAAIN